MAKQYYKIEVYAVLEDIAQRWIDLENRGHASPFQSFAWCHAHFTHLGQPRGASPCIVMVTDEAAREDVLLLPLLIGPDAGARQMISFFDLEVGDYSAPVMAAGFNPGAEDMRNLWGRIQSKLPKADYLKFEKIPEYIGGRPNPLLEAFPADISSMKSYDLYFSEHWEDYHKEKLSHRTRKNLRQRWRKLKNRGETGFMHGDTPQKAQELFDILLRQRRDRFAELGRAEILTKPEYVDFYRALLCSGETGRKEALGIITALTVDGQAIALLYGLLYKGRYSMLLSSFEGGEWGAFSPGLLIVENMMEWLHQRGIREYDFTIGSEPYKLKLGGQEHSLYEYMQAFSLQGRCMSGASSAKKAIKSLLGKN